jgi:hypothetical protein
MSVLFAYENDLCAVLEGRLDGLLEGSSPEQHTRTLRQRPVGQVIPDFLYIRSDRPVQLNQSRGLNPLEASIVALLLPGKPLRAEAIARRLYSRAERVVPRLQALAKRGVVQTVEGGAFSLPSDFEWRSVHVVAVEAKLRRWKEAMEQATSYLKFANQSYVALPSTLVAANKDVAAAASAAQVGVIAVDENGAALAAEAPIQAASSAHWVWLMSRTVGLPTRLSPRDTSTCFGRIVRKPAAIRVDGSPLCAG